MKRTDLRVQLPGEETPAVVVGASMLGGDGWRLEVLDGLSRRCLDLQGAELATTVVIDPETANTRALKGADLAGLADVTDFVATDSPRSDGEQSTTPSGQTSAEELLGPPPAVPLATEGSERHRRGPGPLTAALGVVVLLVVGALGFATGWFAHNAQEDENNASVADVMVPLVDRFDESPGPLAGRVMSGRPGATWADPTGAFEVSDGGAQGATDGDTPALAIVEQTGPVASVRASFSTAVTQAGLVFRYQDEANYWQIVAAPDYGTWAISRVENGNIRTIGDTGFFAGSTVEVIFVGSTIQFWVDGVLREAIRDDFLAESNGIGLIVGPGEERAVCDEILANTV